jgi:7-keto-8-aminopelargonate synthetase-like enzyme
MFVLLYYRTRSDHPIAPVMLGDARLASELADDMLQRGIYVIGFSYPVRTPARIEACGV